MEKKSELETKEEIKIASFPSCAPACASVVTSCLTSKCNLASQGLVLARMCQSDINQLTCQAHNAGGTTYCSSIIRKWTVPSIPSSCSTATDCIGTEYIPIELLVDCPTCTVCTNCNPQLLTYSKGRYAGTGTPGLYMTANFLLAFPAGIIMGSPIPYASGFTNVWNSAASAKIYLRTSGGSGVLSSNATNPASNGTGTFGSSLLSLILSVGFDANNPSFAPTTTVLLGNMILNFSTSPLNTFNGLTVSQFILGCNYRIGAVSSLLYPTYLASFATVSLTTLNGIVGAIVSNYDNGVNLGNLKYC